MSDIDNLIEDVYEKLQCTNYIIDHSKAVYERSKYITQHYDNIDEDLIKAGCMLHDVGRTLTSDIRHAYLGADLLRNLGVDEKICKITERHIGAGVSKQDAKENNLPDRNYIPETFEEKVVAHADNLVHGIKEVDLDFVIEKWTNKGMSKDAIDRLIKLHNELIR
ncbi:MAG: HDIG domain-containing protein [Methanosphaera sp.]|uniref:HD domain-containing protein n=1 Tax=Methanosphaera sp. TaxID=2666342 RepID=UPI0025D11659|nr:HD domain-containing protein [Methanosphaera sp.]MCI5867404.1 HDIG domain-containing protein [Methanosphaera sp.]MDD6534528.1 HDIG domain-containing protein [Methanosphaera sp.]MDY3955803.1 HDIG domain-containing protein [Methanosphaera sp.]